MKKILDMLPQYDKIIRIATIVAAVVMGLGTLLPFCTISAGIISYSENFRFVEGDGIIVLLAAVVVVVMILIKKPKFSFIPSIIGFLVTIYDGINIADKASTASNSTGGLVDASLSIGFYLILLGSIVAVVGGVALFLNNKGKKKNVEN